MPDYQNGKIYKITSGELTYIGSTCEPTLARRLSEHVSCYRRWKEGKIKRGTTAFSLIETGQYEITLIELCPCGSRDELRAKERFHIETNICVNKNIPGRTIKESNKAYRAKNPDKVKAIDRAYKQAHAESEKKRKKEQRIADIDRIKAKDKAYYQANRDKIIERQLKYYKERRAKSQASQSIHIGPSSMPV